jgi:hypothetical protein
MAIPLMARSIALATRVVETATTVLNPSVRGSKPNLAMHAPNGLAPKQPQAGGAVHKSREPKPIDDNDNANGPESKHEPGLEPRQLLPDVGLEEPQSQRLHLPLRSQPTVHNVWCNNPWAKRMLPLANNQAGESSFSCQHSLYNQRFRLIRQISSIPCSALY